ncbi:MAG: BCCT family transporter [Candidatus Dadabacteria bacterium]|nr:BCCT family transporter [Candidatus Dadabacteria bacterium]
MEHGHQAGQDNLQIFGLDINVPVFVTSGIVTLAFIVGALIFQEKATEVLGTLRIWITTQFDWLFMSACNICALFCLFLILSPLGKVRLGGSDAVPRYSRVTWFSMIFTAGVAIGLLFYGVLEPVYYLQNPPLGIDPSDTKAAQAISISAATFHWGLSAWAFYATAGLGLAFFCYNRGLPLTIRSAFHPLLSERVWGWSGHLIDTLAIFATLFGLATSLGLGAKQAVAGLNYLFGIPATEMAQVVFVIATTSLATISVLSGLDVGIKRLSQFNIALALLLLLFVLIAGPTQYIFNSFFVGFADYFAKVISLSSWIGREDTDFLHGWTTFYWAWWISWTPFVGMFIARISRGRTVREFIICVLFLPALCSLLWMSVFGGTAIHQLLFDGYTGVSQIITEWKPELALFKMLELLPMAQLASFVSVVLLIIFFVTSSDSGSLVIDITSAGGKLEPPTGQRVFWCTLEGAVAIALLLGGGLKSLQAASITAGLPFSILLILMTVSIWKGLRDETR